MKNRLLRYRDDLTFPEWQGEYENELQQLYASFLTDTGSAMEFLPWCIGMYLETSHATKRASLFPPIDSDYWEDEE